jgi:alkanesulfonate monooxygenase SsuD/methylene tetrahydromethanopterin reductase-like flavin-dependent oxidoreductase (luciferase family)
MKFGLHYSLGVGVHPTGDDYIRVAQHTEALGYRTIWLGDYIVIPEQIAAPYPYTLRQQRRSLTGYVSTPTSMMR